MRVTLLTNTPTPYRAPLYTLVGKLLHERGDRFTVVYGAEREPRNQWPENRAAIGDVDAVFVARNPLVIRGRATYADPRVVKILHSIRPDVVVIGGYAPWTYWAAAWCRTRRTPYLLWSAETMHTARFHERPALRRRPLWAGATAFLAYGPSAAEYLESIASVDPAHITVLGNGIDVSSFAKAADAVRPNRERIRARLGLQGTTVLCVGAKNLSLVFEAAKQLAPPATVLIAGATISNGNDEHPFVRPVGRIPRSEMVDLYVAADCLVHVPPVDFWPHAINEALAANLPVVASKFTGVPDELLSWPGSSLVDLDPASIAVAVAEAAQVGAFRPGGSDPARRRLEYWGIEGMAERFVAAADAARMANRS
jgi:glycosyltransferase involved in cell wall biosynthesis